MQNLPLVHVVLIFQSEIDNFKMAWSTILFQKDIEYIQIFFILQNIETNLKTINLHWKLNPLM